MAIFRATLMVNKRERRNLKFFVGGVGSVEGGVNEQLSRRGGDSRK